MMTSFTFVASRALLAAETGSNVPLVLSQERKASSGLSPRRLAISFTSMLALAFFTLLNRCTVSAPSLVTGVAVTGAFFAGMGMQAAGVPKEMKVQLVNERGSQLFRLDPSGAISVRISNSQPIEIRNFPIR